MSQTTGEQLRLARSARQISLEQAAKATHIRQRFLEALENDQWEFLPSKVQGRGFLRLYADYLGLDAEKLLHPAVEAPAISVEPSPAVEPLQPEPSSETRIETAENPTIPSKPQSVFAEIGLTLRQRREGISLSLGDVERYTRLRAHYLEAIEGGRIDELPSPVQGRGMISNYAAFLGLDSDAILNRYAEGLQERLSQARPTPASEERKPIRPRSRSGWRRVFSPEVFIFGATVLGLIFLAVWGSAQIAAVQDNSQPTLPSISDEFRKTPTIGLAEGTPDTTGTPQATAQVQATATIPILGNDPLQVYIIAQQRAWMRVIEDGKVVFSGRIVPNTAYPFSAITQLEVYTGSAPAIRIYFNQTEYGQQGRLGEPLQLIFTAQGVITPTPLFTATPTVTPQPTATLQPTNTQAAPTITPLIP